MATISLEALQKKMNKLGLDDWAKEADAKQSADLKKEMVACNANIGEIEKAMEEHPEIVAKKEALKLLTAPFKEAIQAQNLKIKYTLLILESRGEDPATWSGEKEEE